MTTTLWCWCQKIIEKLGYSKKKKMKKLHNFWTDLPKCTKLKKKWLLVQNQGNFFWNPIFKMQKTDIFDNIIKQKMRKRVRFWNILKLGKIQTFFQLRTHPMPKLDDFDEGWCIKISRLKLTWMQTRTEGINHGRGAKLLKKPSYYSYWKF